MSQAPNQYAVERLLTDAASHGDKTRLADALGVSLSEIAQQWNPDEPKKSDYYRFKRMMWALSGINPEAARIIYADFQASIEEWLKPTGKTGELSLLVCDVEKEAGDLIRAKLQDKPAHVQRKEALEIRAAVDRFISELDCADRGSNVREMQR